MDRREALEILELDGRADAAEAKRAYRSLARRHHPDAGGDPQTFHRIRTAYEALSIDTRPRADEVSRGTPSRPQPDDPLQAVDPDSVDWTDNVPDIGEQLDRPSLIRLLNSSLGTGGGSTDVGRRHLVIAASRAPGSRFNRAAGTLGGDPPARLLVAAGRDDRGRRCLDAEIRAWTRKGKRALAAASLDGRWVRHRGPDSTWLLQSVTADREPSRLALYIGDELERMLDSMEWPLRSWTLTAGDA